MAIGYYNYSPLIAQGEQTVNQLAGLGKQIGQAIETHAATQAAQTMLPMIQSQYASGLDKISKGDSSGIADVTQAAGIAGQNPLTQHLSNQMINSATQANENYRNKLITDTRLQTAGLGYISKMAGIKARSPVDAQGNPIPKAPTEYQQAEMQKMSSTARNSQINEFDALYNGNPEKQIDGIGTVADRINKTIKEGGQVSQDDMRKFGSMYGLYKQKQAAYGKNAVSNENIDQAYNDISNHLKTAQEDLSKRIESLPKGTNPAEVPNPDRHWYNAIWTKGNTDLASQKKNLDETIQNLDKIHNVKLQQPGAGGLPAAQGGMARGTAAQDLMQAVQVAKLHPDKIDEIKRRLQKANIDPSLLDQAINPQQQQSAPQSSTMIPAASQNQPEAGQESTEGETE
jgi:hypothetical protein